MRQNKEVERRRGWGGGIFSLRPYQDQLNPVPVRRYRGNALVAERTLQKWEAVYDPPIPRA